MIKFNQEFKVEAVKKALSRPSDQSLNNIADDLGMGYSTLQRWIRLAVNNTLEKPSDTLSNEKSPQDWNKSQRLEAVLDCHSMNEQQKSSYCREKGIYPHHVKQWKVGFLSDKNSADTGSKQDQKKLKQENKRLQKELHRKDKALSETAALLVLSKKCQAIWGEKEEG